MDSKLRDLERHAAGGDLDAQADLIRSRARSGEITQEQIELLAYAQHPPAWTVLGWEFTGHSGNALESFFSRLFTTPGTDLYEVPLALKPWALGFVRWGRKVCLRVGSAACRSRFGAWLEAVDHVRNNGGVAVVVGGGRVMNGPGSPGYTGHLKATAERALRRAEGCALKDDPFRRSQAASTIHSLRSAWAGMLTEDGAVLRPTYVDSLATYAHNDQRAWLADCVIKSPCSVLESSVARTFNATTHLAEVKKAIRHAVRDELVAWLCEGRDPVAERLAAEPVTYRREVRFDAEVFRAPVQSKGPAEAGPSLRYFPSGDRSPGTEAPSSPERSSPNGEQGAEPPAQE